MKVNLSLSLRDKPGMLLKALTPISDHGGNIVSVHHKRGGKQHIPVEVLFKVGDEKTLEIILDALKEEKITVEEASIQGRRYYKREKVSLILIGHVIDRDVQDTIDRLNEIGLVLDVDVRMIDPDKKSSVWMEVDVEEKDLDSLGGEIQKLVGEKEFLLIDDVGGVLDG